MESRMTDLGYLIGKLPPEPVVIADGVRPGKLCVFNLAFAAEVYLLRMRAFAAGLSRVTLCYSPF